MRKIITIKRTARKGLGVFALKDFRTGEIVENCPVLIFDTKQRKNLEKTPLSHYVYPWRSTRGAALAFGYGSLYNHSFKPNADWKQNFKTRSVVLRAIKPIKKGEEVLINYNGEPDDKTEIDWFNVRK
jgi:uncharacterized protein